MFLITRSIINSLIIGILLCTFEQAHAQQDSLTAFPLSAVRLLKSPFYDAQQTDLRYMLALNPDRLLAPFLREAGITPKAVSYANWENTGLDGHIGGHYLSALSDMYAATGNQEVLARLNYMLDNLDKCQQKNGNGYIGGIPGGKAMWEEVASGNIKAGSFSLNDKWVPWYNIHKLFAGLKDAYVVAGNEKAKEMLIKLSDWCLQLTANLNDQQMQQMLRSEHGGMNEVFADVYQITKDKKYLQLARKFSDQSILTPLLAGKDELNGVHANTQIPKVIGYMRIAEVDHDTPWRNAADFFWETVVNNRTVSIGGNSVGEHFHPSGDFSSMIESREGPETCNTYNMLKLTRELFLTDPSGRYMDYYERALYNHILSSQHPGDGGFVYFTSMRPNHYRVYSQPQESFWCCVGSGLENHGKYGDLIYAHNNNDIFVNLFIASTLNWKEKQITLTQNTKFPFTEKSEIQLTLPFPKEFAVHIRLPEWVANGKMKVMVNNKETVVEVNKQHYVSVKRKWKTGDVITVGLPMDTRVEYLPHNSSWVSFIHGPLVLAAATDTTDLKGLFADGSRMGHIANGTLIPLEESPFMVTSLRMPGSAIRPVEGKPLVFTASNMISPQKYKYLKLVPFYQIHDSRYIVYWPITTPNNLATMRNALKETEKSNIELEKLTIDRVNAGQQQPESDHNFKGERTETGLMNNRQYRNAEGWFSYDLKNPSKDAHKLRITYYGRDKDRNFSIYINEVLIKTVKMDGSEGDKLFNVDYELPAVLLNNQSEKLTVRFAAENESKTANVYFVRLLK